MITFNVNPCPEPRMTQSDKWKKRPATTKYWAFCDLIRLEAKRNNYEISEDKPLSLTFFIPITKSWTKKKKKSMIEKPHKQKPDLDNLIKAYKDSLLKDDSKIWWYGEMKKIWSEVGRIEIHES